MAQYIDKAVVKAEIERGKAYAQTMGDNAINRSMQQFYDGMKEGCNSLLNFLDTLEVKEVDSNDVFIDKAWDWIEDNMLSSNQQDKSRLYYKQFENYIKGE